MEATKGPRNIFSSSSIFILEGLPEGKGLIPFQIKIVLMSSSPLNGRCRDSGFLLKKNSDSSLATNQGCSKFRL